MYEKKANQTRGRAKRMLFGILPFVALSLGNVDAAISAELFSVDISGDGTELDALSFPEVTRNRNVKVNLDMLNNAKIGKEDNPLILNLFDDVSVSAVVDHVEKRSDGYAWIGKLKDAEFGHAVFSVTKGVLAGNVSWHRGFYQIRSTGSGHYRISQIDQSVFPDEAEPLPAPPSAANKKTGEADAPQMMSDDGSIIDMLVVYTQAAASASSNILSEINLAVAETNMAYANSGISHRVRLAGTAQISYTETGDASTDLSRLQDASDGYMDNVHSLRNDYRADQVTLITESLNACGIGYLMTSVSSSFKDLAFTVVARGCATGYYSFGHELGHNMGARHDCYVDSTTGSPYDNSHGYVHIGSDASSSWRTIMAYANKCSDTFGTGCNRIPYFSNPNVSYNGNPVGSSGSGCQANNALTFTNTNYTFSNFTGGICTKYGYVDRVTVYPGSSSSYIYMRNSALSNYYTSFTTNDAKLTNAAKRAIPGRTRVLLQGNQSCFDSATDYGGGLDFFVLSP